MNHINGDLSTRLLDVIVDRVVFKNKPLMLSPCFTFTPKQVWDYLKQGLVFTVQWYKHVTSVIVQAHFKELLGSVNLGILQFVSCV